MRHAAVLFLALLALAGRGFAQQDPGWTLEALNENGWAEWDIQTGEFRGTNGAIFRYAGSVITADEIDLSTNSGIVVAEGNVRYQKDEQIWTGPRIIYNFQTHLIESSQFRSGKAPVYMAGQGLKGELPNTKNTATNSLTATNDIKNPMVKDRATYTATNALITTDDIDNPTIKLRAKSMTVIPGDRVIARHATLYIGSVPVFYLPYYSRTLKPDANTFDFVPGYRSAYGPFLLSRYNWILNDELGGALHLDLRERRGVGAGPDFNYHLGQWGDGSLRYYYTYDQDPNASITNAIPHNRERLYFSYLANPYTNFSVRSQVRYQSDIGIIHDFFESEYRGNPQPSTYVEANKFWDNFSMDLYAQPRVNSFYDTIERLPDVRITGWRQQIGESPLYYESQSSAGYYRRLFADTNGPPVSLSYEATRADTFHQVLLPETFFGWLNVTPKVGGRLTYYSSESGPGATTDEVYRGVFNTGAEASLKASRAWPGIQNTFFQIDGIRHIIEPSLNYVYLPRPTSAGTNTIPQFDYEVPSLRLLPIDFPDYNSIDSIDSENVLRMGLHNRIQTKREGQIVNVVDWDLYTDWRIQRNEGQSVLSDLFSDLTLRPKSWLTFESVIRYDVEDGFFRLSLTTLTFKPGESWSWTLGQFYVRDDLTLSPTALGEGDNLFFSSFYYKFNENWGARLSHRFEAVTGKLEEQEYTIYRDLRSWTAALTFRVNENISGHRDFGVGFTFSLKALPRFGLGADAVHPSILLGS
jgi:lipopolysaccharide assembly outer membrane protein LptD (OstA)